MIPKYRLFNARHDSIWFRQTIDLADHLGVVIPELLLGELAKVALQFELELDRRITEAMYAPPPPVVINGTEYRYTGGPMPKDR